MKDKAIIVGVGDDIPLHILRKMEELGVELIDINQEQPMYAMPIENRVLPPMVSPGKTKPTCERNHEYVYSGKEEISPSVYKEKWTCRFCGKEL